MTVLAKRSGDGLTNRRAGRKLAAGACPSQSSGCLDCSYLLSSYDLPTFHHLNVMHASKMLRTETLRSIVGGH